MQLVSQLHGSTNIFIQGCKVTLNQLLSFLWVFSTADMIWKIIEVDAKCLALCENKNIIVVMAEPTRTA